MPRGRPKKQIDLEAVRELASCLEPMAISEDGLVEALWYPQRRFVWAVQWHPEFLCEADDPDSRALFRALVEACGSRRITGRKRRK